MHATIETVVGYYFSESICHRNSSEVKDRVTAISGIAQADVCEMDAPKLMCVLCSWIPWQYLFVLMFRCLGCRRKPCSWGAPVPVSETFHLLHVRIPAKAVVCAALPRQPAKYDACVFCFTSTVRVLELSKHHEVISGS
jgi:hypothetical protein